MATRFSGQFADAGQYTLEVIHTGSGEGWEWWAKTVKPNAGIPEFQGSANTLEGAKKSAMASIGLALDPGWKDMGPRLE
jgi:hypothetical protein